MQGITVMRQQKRKPNKRKYMLKSVMRSWRQYIKARGEEKKDEGGRKDGSTEIAGLVRHSPLASSFAA
jgi:hypothetical protein